MITLKSFASAIAAHLGGLTAPALDVRRPLEHLRSSAQSAVPSPSTVTDKIAASSQLGARHDYGMLVASAARRGVDGPVSGIASALLALRVPLPWEYHYEPHSSDANLARNIAFAELIGPDGPMNAPACRVGFTVMSEHTFYPLHMHPAVELYLVITGHAQWCTPTSDRLVAPNELVLHRSNEPHSMRTYDEPLLARWGWSGDVDTPAAYV